MANTKSIQKIKDYLKEKQTATTPSDICVNVNLRWKSVLDCLNILRNTNQLEILSSGKTTLIRLKEVQKNDD